jgi:hypothetical protein
MNAEDLISGLTGYLSSKSGFGSNLPEYKDIYSELGKSRQYDILTALADPMKSNLLRQATILRGITPEDITIG